MKNLITLLLITVFLPWVNGQNKQDDEVIQAVLDYADGYYSGNPDRIGAVLHPDFVKIMAFTLPQAKKPILQHSSVTVLVEHARAKSGYVEPGERKIDVEVLYRKDNIAAAQLTSARFNDFVQLIQIDGEWKIVNVLWTAVRGDPSGPPELIDPALQEKQAIEAIENYLTALYSADPEKLIRVIHPEISIAQYKIIESTGRPTIERSGASFITELCRAGYLKNAEGIQSQEVQVLGMMNEMAFLRFKSIRANVFFQMQLIENQWRIINILSVPDQA